MSAALGRRAAVEALGTALLVGTVVGCGIMAERLTGDVGLALLCNTIPTGAHFNIDVGWASGPTGILPRLMEGEGMAPYPALR